jgi:uncharacterized protein involved in exopolysaccharide biosynthesis
MQRVLLESSSGNPRPCPEPALVSIRRQLTIVLARLPLLIASVAISALAAYAFSSVQPKVYESDATLIVGQSLSAVNPDYNQLLVSQRLSSTYATVATTRPVGGVVGGSRGTNA